MAIPADLAAIDAAIQAGRPTEARARAEAILAKEPVGSTRHTIASRLYALLLVNDFADPDAARDAMAALVARAPDDWPNWVILTHIETVAGRKAQVAAAARRAVDLNPLAASAYGALFGAEPAEGPRLAAKIEELLPRPDIIPAARRSFLHTLGKIRDRAGDYDRAFEAFSQANAVDDPGYDADHEERILAEARMVFTPDFFAARAGHGLLGDAIDARRMIFVVGMPRSGTTLLEQTLSAHPDIAGLGERQTINRLNEQVLRAVSQAGVLPPEIRTLSYAHLAYVSEADSRALAQRYLAASTVAGALPPERFWIDKLPGNYSQLGLIRLLFPNATILWAERDLRDVALSCFQAAFEAGHNYARSVERMAHALPLHLEHRRFWMDLFGDWIRPVAYEDLVADPKATLAPVLDGLGLDWSDDCARTEDRKGYVRTASVFQVRDAIHNRSIGRWRNYATHLAPVVEALDAYEQALAA